MKCLITLVRVQIDEYGVKLDEAEIGDGEAARQVEGKATPGCSATA